MKEPDCSGTFQCVQIGAPVAVTLRLQRGSLWGGGEGESIKGNRVCSRELCSRRTVSPALPVRPQCEMFSVHPQAPAIVFLLDSFRCDLFMLFLIISFLKTRNQSQSLEQANLELLLR